MATCDDIICMYASLAAVGDVPIVGQSRGANAWNVFTCWKAELMAKSALTKGLVAGKSTGLIGNRMTVNPTIDTTNGQLRAMRALAIHSNAGVVSRPNKDGASQPSNRAVGTRLNGGARISGGEI